MAFADIRAGIHTNLRTYTGVTNIIGGMPTSIQRAPAWITQFEYGEKIGQTFVFHWHFRLHCIIDHQVNDLAETDIDVMVPKVFEAFSGKLYDGIGNPRSTLGGAASHSWFEDVRSGDFDGYITLGEGDYAKKYRRIGVALVVKTHEEF